MAKILFVASKDNNYYNFRSEFILELLRLGHQVVLVCPAGDKIQYFIDRGCRFVSNTIDRRGTNVFKDLRLIWQYIKIFRKENPDVVLAYTGKSSAYGGLACRLLNIPYIINNAGLLNPKYYNPIVGLVLEMLYRVSFCKAECMMYQNTEERDYLNKVLKNKIRYRDIPGSGVNLSVFQLAEYPQNDDKITFNFVGRIVKIKGITEFLDCAEHTKSKYANTRFVIYGAYDDERYRERIEELVKKEMIEYGGVQIDMKPYIAAAHAVIHPSYYEGMTNVVLEHSAMGRPSIGSNVAGVMDGIDDGETGFIFEVGNSKSLINTVEKFIQLPHEKKIEMGLAARKKMEQQFDRRIVTDIYIEEVNRIIQKTHK